MGDRFMCFVQGNEREMWINGENEAWRSLPLTQKVIKLVIKVVQLLFCFARRKKRFSFRQRTKMFRVFERIVRRRSSTTNLERWAKRTSKDVWCGRVKEEVWEISSGDFSCEKKSFSVQSIPLTHFLRRNRS